MDRDIQRGERYGDFFDSHCNSHSATSSWSSDDPPPHHERNFDTYRGGFAGDGPHHHRRPYHNRNHPNPNHHYQLDFQNFNSEHVSVGGSGGDINPGHSLPLPGRKRQFPHSSNGASKDYIDGGSYVKLYVGGIPRTSTEEQIRSLFEEHGNIVEVVLLKDKRTGQQQECCFVKYSKLEEADRAIGALHNQYIFSAGGFSMKVKYADGERERLGGLGTHECKLYVGCINRQACKWEIEEIFSAYGHVEDVYIVRDDLRQNRGCGFVQFSHRDMAVAAMNALNGLYVMRGCEQPLIVRFAEPKRPRVGESRANCKFGGSSIGSRFQEPFVRPAPNLNDPMAGHMLPNASLSLSPKTMASSSQVSSDFSIDPVSVSINFSFDCCINEMPVSMNKN
ncbi:hypothetical protein U1Q18_034454 [Sarracenia purpurea var. burkii]